MDEVTSGSFYVRLDSANGFSNTLWPDNSSTSFKNLLPNPLVLPRAVGFEWQVALADLILPNGFYNIPKHMTKFVHVLNPVVTLREGPIYTPFYIPPGFYDPISFVNAINDAFEKVKPDTYDRIKMEYAAVWRFMKGEQVVEGEYDEPLKFKMRYLPVSKEYSIRLNLSLFEHLMIENDDLRHTMGCQTLATVLRNNGPLGFPCNMNRFFANLFVSCDIVKYSIIGNQMSPILRVFQLSSLLNQTYQSTVTGRTSMNTSMAPAMLSPNIQRRQYYPVSEEVIKAIGLHLSNENGKTFHFDNSVRDGTFATLHFRRVRQGGWDA